MSPKKRISKEKCKDLPEQVSTRLPGEDKPLRVDRKYRNEPGSQQILESIRNMDDDDLIETISYERKRLNDMAQKALEDCGNLDVEIVREQNRIVESLLSEALLRRVESSEERE